MPPQIQRVLSKRSITYCRVSTREQDDNGYSLPTQLAACHKEAAKRGLIVSPELTFSDDFSGATLERPGLRRLRDAVKRGDTVIVLDPDRLSRDDVDFLIICREFERANVDLVFVNGGEVPNSPEGDIVRYLMGWKGKRERAQIIERTQRGKRAKAAGGKWVGNTHPPYGYRKIGKLKEAHLAIDDGEALVVRSIFSRFISGDGIRGIADELTARGVQSPSRGKVGRRWYEHAIKHILKSQVYLGIITNYGETISNPSLGIVSQDTWDAAQARLAINHRQYCANRKRDYLLSSFMNCICGQRMYGVLRKPKKTAYLYYCCYSVMHRLDGCREPVLPLPKVDAIVWDWITSILCDDERREAGLRDYARRRAEGIQPLQAELDAVDDLITKAERKVNRYAAEFGNEPSETVADALRLQMDLAGRELSSQRERRASLQAAIAQGTLSQERIDEIGRMTAAIRRRLPGDPTTLQKRDLFDVLGVNVKLRRDDAGLRWLDMTCGIPDWGLSANYDSSRTDLVSGKRLVVFSASRPLDAQPGPTLADSLFSGARWPALAVS